MLTALLWIPYVANRFRELGLPGWGWFPEPDPPPLARWAERATRAHANAVENLVVFAPLVLAVHVAGQGDAVSAAKARNLRPEPTRLLKRAVISTWSTARTRR